MSVEEESMRWGISAVAAACVAFGVVKGRMHNFMTYDKHREICAKEHEATNTALTQLFDGQKEAHGLIKEIHGYLKAKNGGNL